MLVYGVVSPHPPIILPWIGEDRLNEVKSTISSLKRCRKRIHSLNIDNIFIISPHEDHGFEVPLYYLQNDVPKENIEKRLVGFEDYQWYYDEGCKIGEQIERDSGRWCLIASGDLSHALKEEGPYSFHPDGPKLDKEIVEAFKLFDPLRLLKLDRQFIENGAECGLRSILFLMGAFKSLVEKGKKVGTRVLSYEGPWGVGYMVAEVYLID